MIEDELLKLRFKRGSEDALRRIYEKYLNYLLSVAMTELSDNGQGPEALTYQNVTDLARSLRAAMTP
jgi:hypothetical protein